MKSANADEIFGFALDEIKSTHPPSRRIAPNEVGFHRRRRFHPPARVDLVENDRFLSESVVFWWRRGESWTFACGEVRRVSPQRFRQPLFCSAKTGKHRARFATLIKRITTHGCAQTSQGSIAGIRTPVLRRESICPTKLQRKTCEIAAKRQFRGVDSRAATKKPRGTLMDAPWLFWWRRGESNPCPKTT